MTLELRAVLDRLQAAEEGLDPFARMNIATHTLALSRDDSPYGPQLGEVFLMLHTLTEGATDERCDKLVRTLQVLDPARLEVLATAAGGGATAAEFESACAFWRVVADLAEAVRSAG